MARRPRRPILPNVDLHTLIADKIDLIMGLALLVGAIALFVIPR